MENSNGRAPFRDRREARALEPWRRVSGVHQGRVRLPWLPENSHAARSDACAAADGSHCPRLCGWGDEKKRSIRGASARSERAQALSGRFACCTRITRPGRSGRCATAAHSGRSGRRTRSARLSHPLLSDENHDDEAPARHHAVTQGPDGRARAQIPRALRAVLGRHTCSWLAATSTRSCDLRGAPR